MRLGRVLAAGPQRVFGRAAFAVSTRATSTGPPAGDEANSFLSISLVRDLKSRQLPKTAGVARGWLAAVFVPQLRNLSHNFSCLRVISRNQAKLIV